MFDRETRVRLVKDDTKNISKGVVINKKAIIDGRAIMYKEDILGDRKVGCGRKITKIDTGRNHRLRLKNVPKKEIVKADAKKAKNRLTRIIAKG